MGSRTLAKSEAFIKEVEGAQDATPYGSYEEVLDDPRVIALYIPLPTSMHVQWVEAAAAKGKHILLEKPIAMVGLQRSFCSNTSLLQQRELIIALEMPCHAVLPCHDCTAVTSPIVLCRRMKMRIPW